MKNLFRGISLLFLLPILSCENSDSPNNNSAHNSDNNTQQGNTDSITDLQYTMPEVAETLSDVNLDTTCDPSKPAYCYSDTVIFSCQTGYDIDDTG